MRLSRYENSKHERCWEESGTVKYLYLDVTLEKNDMDGKCSLLGYMGIWLPQDVLAQIGDQKPHVALWMRW